MHTPPFRLARTPGIVQPEKEAGTYPHAGDACCQPARPQLSSFRRRVRLAELDPHLHCSVIGTCLTTHELRKIVSKFANVDRERASDLEIHHAAVELAMEGGAGGKALHKALDERYAGAIRRFDKAGDAEALLAMWDEALGNGDIPPAYWALMTHPQATIHERQVAFGALHMLSHLVGAANRADIRRLVALEAENATLRDRVERQQKRLHEMSIQRDASICERSAQIAQLTAQLERKSVGNEAGLEAEVSTLRDALATRDARLALHTSRREAAEQRAAKEQEYAQALRESLDEALALLDVVQAEAGAMERTMQLSAEAPDAHQALLDALGGKRIVYVGGRPGSNAALRRIVESAGGELTLHDGGVEDRKGLLAAALPRADMVVFPVDCVDHDSMNMLKRVCERHQVTYYPLRTASIASFVERVTRAHATSLAAGAPRASRFCLRHG
ncbi:DUF2325 domain-containing protein [Paraburkholderia sartisoli]|uniref:Uncharacterized protein n=1 Tax=Paraburkholderia sartisoli TaxID=83784 RepID=A0A1H4HEG6_9BURK|nr:DUF2325 domain-containing protein [Paraburkholderia sartisoli]SEB20229.1 hypothetical protein SAMN05192564_108187 [Paraburkholderia sartisoli]